MKKMGRCLQVHIQIKEPFFVLYVTNQVQSRFHCHHHPPHPKQTAPTICFLVKVEKTLRAEKNFFKNLTYLTSVKQN